MRRALSLVMCAATWATTAPAQNPAPPDAGEVPGVVHYGKWGAAGLFVMLTTAGVFEHHRADNAFHGLQEYCFDRSSCTIGPDGRYPDAEAESRYHDVVTGDRAARTLLLSGQVALVGAGALFVVELLRDKGAPNIPFSGLIVAPHRGGLRLGWSLPIGSP